MTQTTLTSFLTAPSRIACDDCHPIENVLCKTDHTVGNDESTIEIDAAVASVVSVASESSSRKRGRDNSPSPREHGGTVVDWDRAQSVATESYYSQHAEEFHALVANEEVPTTTSMAKLLHDNPVDVYAKFAHIWPRAKSATAAQTPAHISSHSRFKSGSPPSTFSTLSQKNSHPAGAVGTEKPNPKKSKQKPSYRAAPRNEEDNLVNTRPFIAQSFDSSNPQDTQQPLSPRDHHDPVTYRAVTDTLADISATGSRLECIHHLTFLLYAVLIRSPTDLVAVMYLVTNKQAPSHEGIELGVGDALLRKVIAEACGMTEEHVRHLYRCSGDLAEVAQENKHTQATLVQAKPLLARTVFSALKEIACLTGKEVMRRRGDTIRRLLISARGAEVNFIIRALQQKMRIGLAESSALAALSYALVLYFLGMRRVTKEMSLEQVQTTLNMSVRGFTRIFYEVPSLDVVCGAVLKYGFMVLLPGSRVSLAHAEELSIRPGLPVKPQLAHPTKSISVILDRLQDKKFTSEYKYDGERAQIHYSRACGFHIFSRNSETHTDKYPDVIATLRDVFDTEAVESFILDSEVVAVSSETGALQAFQVLQHRGRKNIAIQDVTIPVCVFAFDLLYFNGVSMLSRTLTERRQVLWSSFRPVTGKFSFATHIDSDSVEDIQKFLDRTIADGCEGLMIKTLDEHATYTPAKRSRFWLKLKKDYMSGATDTFDLAPIGAYYGRGKRTGVFGGFLLACYDPDTDEYQSVCKISTGFTDEELESVTRALTPLVVQEKPRYYRADNSLVNVWLRECQVWEVKAADLSISPVHFAAIGLVDPSRGIALRFPRFLHVREDKSPTDCTTAQQVAEMYRAQSILNLQENDQKDCDEIE